MLRALSRTSSAPSTTASTSSHSTPLDILKLIDRKVKRRVSSLIWFSSSYVEIVLQIRLEFDEMKFAGLGCQDGICQFARVEIMSI